MMILDWQKWLVVCDAIENGYVDYKSYDKNVIEVFRMMGSILLSDLQELNMQFMPTI